MLTFNKFNYSIQIYPKCLDSFAQTKVDYCLETIVTYQSRLSTETICLLTNFIVTSYFSFRSDIFRHVENLKFRKHTDSITFIWSIACWLPVNDYKIENTSINWFMGFIMDDAISGLKKHKIKRHRKVFLSLRKKHRILFDNPEQN